MKRILVLEDEANIRSFVVINLRRSGFEPIEAENGAMLQDNATGSFTDLQARINATSANGTLKLDRNYTAASTEKGIEIKKTMTLDLNGATINRGLSHGVYFLTEGLKAEYWYLEGGGNGDSETYVSNLGAEYAVIRLTGGAHLTIATRQADAQPVLAVTDYKVNRGARPVIAEPISFALKEGDIAILEAPNGWGKSTLLESIAGLIPAAAGKVELQGEDVTALPVWKRARKGLRLNRAAGTLFTQATVQENARLNHVAEPILPALSSRKAGSLSGGESRRLSFEAVLNNPEAKILMLDEPFQALDITESARVRRSLSNSQKTNLVTVPREGEYEKE